MKSKITLIFMIFMIFNICYSSDITGTELRSKEWRLETSISYLNIRKLENFYGTIDYQLPNGSSVLVPFVMDLKSTNNDYISMLLKIRYALTDKFELFASLSWFYTVQRSAFEPYETIRHSGFESIEGGFSYKVKKEDQSPSLFIGLRTKILEKSYLGNNLTNKFKSWSLFATSYYSIDPVVLAFMFNYKLNLKRKLYSDTVNRWNEILVTPQIYIIINPFITFNFGVEYSYRGKVTDNKKILSNTNSSLGYLFGVSYEFSDNFLLDLNYKNINNNDITINSFNISLIKRF